MERELIEQARGGDRAAFEALVRLKVDAVYGTALAILGHEADAQDAVQDAFVSAWRSMAGLRDPDRFEAWFGRIVVNACRMSLRKRRGVREITVQSAGGDAVGAGWRSAGPPELRPAAGRPRGLRRRLRPGIRTPDRRRTGAARPPPPRRAVRGRDRGAPGDPGRDRQVAPVRGPAGARARAGAGRPMSERPPEGWDTQATPPTSVEVTDEVLAGHLRRRGARTAPRALTAAILTRVDETVPQRRWRLTLAAWRPRMAVAVSGLALALVAGLLYVNTTPRIGTDRASPSPSTLVPSSPVASGPVWDPSQRALTPPELLRILATHPASGTTLIVDDQVTKLDPNCPAVGTCLREARQRRCRRRATDRWAPALRRGVGNPRPGGAPDHDRAEPRFPRERHLERHAHGVPRLRPGEAQCNGRPLRRSRPGS